MKKILLILAAMFTVLFVFSQNEFSETIKGTVFDKGAEYPLIGVTIGTLLWAYLNC